MKRVHPYILLLLVVLATACNPAQRNKEADKRPMIISSIEPLRYFTEAIAGPHYRVESMVPQGHSPEHYDPAPSQLVTLAQSRAFLGIGYIGYERIWLERLRAQAPRVPFINVSEGIALITDHPHHPAAEASHTHHHAVEPHTWTSPRNARLIARNICDALCSLDTLQCRAFRARCDSLCHRIDRLDSLMQHHFSSPDAPRAFAIYHPSLSYLARDYNLTQLCIEEAGREPSPAHLKQFIEHCRELGVKHIFVQPEFDISHAEIIAREIGAKVITIHPLAYDWEAEMLHIIESFQSNP